MRDEFKTTFTVALGITSALLVLTLLSGGLIAPFIANQAVPATNFIGTPASQGTANPSYSSNFSNMFSPPTAHGQGTLLATMNSGFISFLSSLSFLVIISIGLAVGISVGVSHKLNKQLD